MKQLSRKTQENLVLTEDATFEVRHKLNFCFVSMHAYKLLIFIMLCNVTKDKLETKTSLSLLMFPNSL